MANKVEYKYHCKDCQCNFFAQSDYTESVNYCPICGTKEIFIINPTEKGKHARVNI